MDQGAAPAAAQAPGRAADGEAPAGGSGPEPGGPGTQQTSGGEIRPLTGEEARVEGKTVPGRGGEDH